MLMNTLAGTPFEKAGCVNSARFAIDPVTTMNYVPFNKLTKDEQRDPVVAVGLGEIDAAIPPAKKRFSLFGLGDPVASDFTSYSREINEMDAEEVMAILDGEVLEERFRGIE